MILLIWIALFFITSFVVRFIVENMLYWLSYTNLFIFSCVLLLIYILMIILGIRLTKLWRAHKKKTPIESTRETAPDTKRTAITNTEKEKNQRIKLTQSSITNADERLTTVSSSLSALKEENTISQESRTIDTFNGGNELESNVKSKVRFCRRCGSELEEGTSICSKCGTPVIES